MTKQLFSTILLFLCYSSIAQTQVTLGTPYAVVDAGFKTYFEQDNEILTVKVAGRKVTLQKLDAVKLTFIGIHTYEDMPDGFQLENVMEHHGRHFVFFTVWDKPNKTEQLFYREIDFKSGAFLGENKRIIAVDQKIVGGYTFEYSNDKSKIMIQYRLKPTVRNDSKNYDVIGFSVFDQNLLPIWNKEVTMPYTEKKMNNIDYSVDSQGDAYILTTVYNDNSTDEKKRGEDQANYHMELLKISSTSSEIVITPIEVGEKFVNSVGLFESQENYMYCAGYYTNKGNFDSVDGIFLFKIGKDGRFYDVKTYEIPLEIINQYISERAQRKNEKREEKGDDPGLNNLDLKKLIVQGDGSLVLVGERFFIETRSYYDFQSKRTRTTTIYHYDDMLITKIGSNGQLAWMRKLPKRQTLTTSSSHYGYSFSYTARYVLRGGLSYEYMAGDHKHYLIFLDNEKNKDLKVDEVPAVHVNGAGGFVTAYEINDEDGKVNKYSLLDLRNVQGMEVYQFSTDRILPTSSNQFVLEVYKKKKEDILIQVTFPK
ncbi:MAG: hypothetical protein K0R51_590 [Cytophagaceae bacterium]|nr:hypothetical protein [Cytophagaceae bacterium]